MIDVYECEKCGKWVEFAWNDRQENDEFYTCKECFDEENDE